MRAEDRVPRTCAVYKGRGAALHAWVCPGTDSGEHDEVPQAAEIVFVTRGMFAARVGARELFLTPNEVWLPGPYVPYSIRHPRGGDECTVITVDRAMVADYGDAGGPAVHVSPAAFRLQHELLAEARAGQLSPAAFEENVRLMLASLFAPSPAPMTDRHRRAAARVQEFLASNLAENVTIADAAAAAGISPHHLCRIFRRVTGQSIHQYHLSLRLRAALARIAAGDMDLTGIALDLGFYDHSHFTNCFRRAFGFPPVRFRALHTRGGGAGRAREERRQVGWKDGTADGPPAARR